MTAGREPPPEAEIVVDSKAWTGDPPPPMPPKPQKPLSKWGLALSGAFLLGLSIWAFRLLWLGFETGTVAVPVRGGHASVSSSDRPAAYVLVMAYWSMFPLFWVAMLYRAVTSREARRRFVAMWRAAP